MPKLSYCCIFKNEAKHLPKWIECAKAVACEEGDEIIACDTGSTDDSCKLLRDAGIEPLYFEWIQDFSAAKNFVIEKTKGDWILFLDCDEYFSPETLPFVRKVIDEADKNEKVMIIQSHMHNINEDDNNKLISTCYHWRIFRHHPQVRYTEPIHEYIKYFGNDGAIVLKSELLILHTGYSSTLAKSKGLRNLEFLEADIAKNEGEEISTKQAFYMANTYAQIGDMEKAAEYAEIAVKGPDEELGFMTVKMYKDLLQREEMKEGGGDFATKIDILDRALLRGPDQPDFLIDKARIYLQKEYFYEAEMMCFKALEKLQDPEVMQRFESNASAIVFFIYNIISNIKFFKGDVLEARRFVVLGLMENKDDRSLLANLVKCFRYEVLSIVQPIMEQVFGKNPSKEERQLFKDFFKAMNYGDVYLYYVKPKSNSFEYYMCKGLYAKAIKVCEKELLELFKYAAFCHAVYPKESQILKAAVPEKHLFGMQKQPKGTMTLEELMNKMVDVFAKIIMACFSMTDEEFELNKNHVLNFIVPPTRDFLLAGFNQATQGVQTVDTEKFYKLIAPYANKVCLQRLAKVIGMMPSTDEFLLPVIKDLAIFKELQWGYDLLSKVEKQNADYYILMGVILFYAGEIQKARDSFIKARSLGGYSQEVKDFIKWTDPSGAVVVNL